MLGCTVATDVLVWITRICPNLLDLSQVVKPETILRWHRSGFKAFWRWKSRHRAGRPKIDRGLRRRLMSAQEDERLRLAHDLHFPRILDAHNDFKA